MDDLPRRIVEYVEKHPSSRATEIARALKVTRKEVNSTLYRGGRTTFVSAGEDPPLWSLRTTPTSDGNEKADAVSDHRNPDQVVRDAGIEDRRSHAVEMVERQVLLGGELFMKCGEVVIDVILVEQSLSDPYVTFELEGLNQLSVIINTTMIPERHRDSTDGVVQHITHCVADSLCLRAMQDSFGVLDRGDIFAIKSSILAEITSSQRREIAK